MANLTRHLRNRYVWALGIIVMVVITLVTAALIPQYGQVDVHEQEQWLEEHAFLGGLAEALGLDDLYTSWWVLLLTALLAGFLAYDFVVRLRRLTRSRLDSAAPAVTRRVRLGIYGSLFFHCCLLVLMLGAVADLLWGFHGTIYLTEGQAERELSGTYAFVRNGPLGDDSHKGFILRHVSFDTAYTGYGASTPAALLRFYDDQTIAGERWVAVNHPARFRGVRVYLGGDAGYTPHLVISDTTGRPLLRSFIRLAARSMNGILVHADYVPGVEPRELYCVVNEGNPLQLELELDGGEQGGGVAAIAPPATATVGDLRVSVDEVRRWSRFELSYHPGETVVFAGFWGAIIGLVWRFSFPRPPRREAQ